MRTLMRKISMFAIITMSTVFAMWLIWNIWGRSVSFELAFSYESTHPVRMESDAGYWFSVYSNPSSYYSLSDFIEDYRLNKEGGSLLNDHEVDLKKYTYIVCNGMSLRRLACSPFDFDGIYVGKAFVKRDSANRVNVYRIDKLLIDVGHPPSGSRDFTVVLPNWLP